MDANLGEIEAILESMILTGSNLDVHTASGETAWAPIVQASTQSLLLPTYGMDINPFLFLLTDLRARFESDWFRAANNREGRWIDEIQRLFEGPRWLVTAKGIKLRHDGKVATDVDVVIFDRKTNELALVQLKWQHPIGMDNRGRRSAGKNLTQESNRWIGAVTTWLDRYGGSTLLSQIGLHQSRSPSIHLFVVARYHAHITGYEDRDARAVWSDWAHFRRARAAGPRRSVSQLQTGLRYAVERSRDRKLGESTMFPVGDLSIVFNPKSVPD